MSQLFSGKDNALLAGALLGDALLAGALLTDALKNADCH